LTSLIQQAELNVDLRERGQEFRHDRLQVQAAERDRRGYAELAARRRVLADSCALRLGDVGENALGRGDVGAPRIRRHQRATRPVEQLGAQMRLQLGNFPADGGQRHLLAARGRRQAAGLRHR
jgi:hypothetical protein